MPGMWISRLIYSIGRIPVWQWTIVSVVGILLGAYISFIPAIRLPEQITASMDISSRTWSLLFILIAMAPFLGLIATGVSKNLRLLLFFVMLMEIPIQIDYRFGYSEAEQKFGAVSGFTVSVTTVCLIILYVWWLAEILGKRNPPPSRSLYKLILPGIIYLTIVVMSIFLASDVHAAINWIGLFAQSFLLYFYVIHRIRTKEDLLFIATILLIGLIFNSVLIVGYGATGRSAPENRVAAVSSNSTDVERVGGPLKVPNLTGSYLALVLVPVFGLLSIPREWWYRWMIVFAIGMGGMALLWTGSRGAWGSFGLAALLLGYLLWRQGWLSLKVPMAFVILALTLVLIFNGPILERMFGDAADQAAAARSPLNIIATRMIWDHILLGVGANNFAANLRWYVTSEFTGEWIRTVHNQYLLVWAETGIIGLTAYLWFLFSTILQGWKVWLTKDRILSPLALGFTTSLIAALIHMTGEKYHARIQLDLVWLMAGLVTATYRIHRGDWDNTTDASLLPIRSVKKPENKVL